MTITPHQRLAELRRELATRRQVYPGWVSKGKLTQATADHRIQVLVEVIQDLQLLYNLPAELANPTLFT